MTASQLIHFFDGCEIQHIAVFIASVYFIFWPILRWFGDIAFKLGQYCALYSIRKYVYRVDLTYHYVSNYPRWWND